MSNKIDPQTQLPPIRDAFFGELRWDPHTDSYVAEITVSTVGTIQVSIRIEHRDPFIAVKDIQGAQKSLSVILINETLYRQTAAAALIERYHTARNAPGTIDVEAVMSRMKLEAVSFYFDDTALWYADGDMFNGRTIYVTVNKERQFEDVEVVL